MNNSARWRFLRSFPFVFSVTLTVDHMDKYPYKERNSPKIFILHFNEKLEWKLSPKRKEIGKRKNDELLNRFFLLL